MLFNKAKAANYEVAVSVLGSMIGLNSRAQHEEQNSANPDRDESAKLKLEHARLWAERHALQLDDECAVNRVLSEYGPIVKEGLKGLA
jgi:hypothetical protein